MLETCTAFLHVSSSNSITPLLSKLYVYQRPALVFSGVVLCRHPQSTARSTGRESQEHQRRVLWNTEMLSYTVYAADECGKVTTWDLKAVLLILIHM